jgi:hypothetical protein
VSAPAVPYREAQATSFLDRALAVVPLATIYLLLAIVYGFEASKHPTPSIFTDELKWTQFARAIAHHGTASIRGEHAGFQTLYVYLLAPAWWIHDTATAYAVVKYLNVFAMTSAIFPAYLLARRFVSTPSALLVAAASGAIPSLAYSLAIVPEVIAYPWAVLCAWLIVESLGGRGRRWTWAAIAVSILAPLVRGQLVVIPAAYAIAALALWLRGPAGRRLRADWSRTDSLGAVLLAIGVFVFLNRWIGNGNGPWHITTTSYRGKIVDQIVWSVGALAIGIGVLPLVGGLVALVPRRGERTNAYDRAFVATAASFLGTFALYTGVKAAYLSITFATRVEERNMIYVSPLLFLGTAIVLERRRLRWWALAAAVAMTAWALAATPLQLDWPYFEALGFSIAATTNRDFYWTNFDIRNALYVALGISVLLIAARWWLRQPLERGARVAAGVAGALVAVVVVGWNLTGEISAAVGSDHFSTQLMTNLPQPPDWIDQAAGSGTVTYFGQQIRDLTGENLLEFWNRSIVKVWSVDGTAPLPGPTLTPNLNETNGTLSNPPGTDFVLADNGVRLVGPVVASRGNLILYRLHGPIRLAESQIGVYPDGWIASDGAYNRFETPGHKAGIVRVTLSRLGFGGNAPFGHATVKVGPVVIGPDKEPGLERLWATRHAIVKNGREVNLDIPVGKPPWRVEIHVTPTFKPSDYGVSDGRDLGAVVGFRFIARH